MPITIEGRILQQLDRMDDKIDALQVGLTRISGRCEAFATREETSQMINVHTEAYHKKKSIPPIGNGRLTGAKIAVLAALATLLTAAASAIMYVVQM